jgi:DNA polymerase IV
VDMDAFFAAIEARRHPELADKPLIVGGRGDPTKRGVVSTASYAARKRGIHSGMPLRRALQLCPDAVFLPVDFKEYEKISAQIKTILRQFSPIVEDAGIDEAFLDISGIAESAAKVARKIKDTIKSETGLTCSVGIGPNKLVAKLASDMQKPDGLTVIEEADIQARIWPLAVGKLPGVGPKTEARLRASGVETIGDLAAVPAERLVAEFGEAHGGDLYEAARGIDESPLITHWEPRSVGRQSTFDHDMTERPMLAARLIELVRKAVEDMRGEQRLAGTVAVKVRFKDFETLTREETLPQPAESLDLITRAAFDCLNRVELAKPVRLLGIRLGELTPRGGTPMESLEKKSLAAMAKAAGGRFSTELGIGLRSADSHEIFKWFLASLLLAARISQTLAFRTYREFEKKRLMTAAKIASSQWNDLVSVLDAGGYVRYDFKTATKLQEICQALVRNYGGDLNRVHRAASDPSDLEQRIEALGKGIGEVTINIFLRELRGIWEKADPLPSELALSAAKRRRLIPAQLTDRRRALAILRERWLREKNKAVDFADFEAALIRQGLAIKRKARRESLDRGAEPRVSSPAP